MKQIIISILLVAGLASFIKYYTPLMIFIDMPSLILVLGMTLVMTISRFNVMGLVKEPKTRLAALDYISKIAPIVGVLGSIIGLIQMLHMISEPSLIGPPMAVCLLSVVCGGMISLVATCYKTTRVGPLTMITIGSGLSVSVISVLILILALR